MFQTLCSLCLTCCVSFGSMSETYERLNVVENLHNISTPCPLLHGRHTGSNNCRADYSVFNQITNQPAHEESNQILSTRQRLVFTQSSSSAETKKRRTKTPGFSIVFFITETEYLCLPIYMKRADNRGITR